VTHAFDKKSIMTVAREELLSDPSINEWFQETDFENLLIAPLIYREQSKGLLLLARREAGLTPEEQSPLEILTSRLTAAFLNREAYEYLHRLSDVTARRNIELQEELAQYNTKLSYTSHDLKTPLNAIMGYASLLQGGIMDDQKRGPAIDRILVNAKDLLRIIDRMLQSEEGKGEQVEVNLESLILNQIDNQLIPLLFGKEVEVAKEIEPGIQIFTNEPDLIKHILSNLFSNAAKFTSTGTVSISAKSVANDQRNGIELIVSDTGVGIDPKRLPHIFDPFNHEPGYEGSGLGLSIIRDIVSRMEGNIKVKSERGRGTEFWIWFPLKRKS
jgi:signal transduction histidine kinase